MSITFSEDSGAHSIDTVRGSLRRPPLRLTALFEAGRSLRLEAALPGRRCGCHLDLAVDSNPQSDAAPELSARAIRAYSKGGFSQLVFQAKRDYVVHYGFDTAYWRTHTRADHPEVAAELETEP